MQTCIQIKADITQLSENLYLSAVNNIPDCAYLPLFF